MKTKQLLTNKYTITYDKEEKLFSLLNENGEVLETSITGKRLGRVAWARGAEEVCYSYDLNLDKE
jgi:hypothetical protein